MRRSEDTNQLNKIENSIFRIESRSPRGQWVHTESAPCIQYLRIDTHNCGEDMGVYFMSAQIKGYTKKGDKERNKDGKEKSMKVHEIKKKIVR